jgi:hypothetical protein
MFFEIESKSFNASHAPPLSSTLIYDRMVNSSNYGEPDGFGGIVPPLLNHTNHSTKQHTSNIYNTLGNMMDKYLINDKDVLLKSESFTDTKNTVSQIISEIDKLSLFLNSSLSLNSNEEYFTFSKLVKDYPRIVHILFINNRCNNVSNPDSSSETYKCIRNIMTAFGELKNERVYLEEVKHQIDARVEDDKRQMEERLTQLGYLTSDTKTALNEVKMTRKDLLLELPKLRKLYSEMSELSKWDTYGKYFTTVLKESFEQYCKTREKYNHIIKIKELNEAHYKSFNDLSAYIDINFEDETLKTILNDKHKEDQIFIKGFVEKLELDKIKNQMEDHLAHFKFHMKLLNDSVLSFVKPSCCKSCLVNVPNKFISKCGHIMCEHCTNVLFGKNNVTECPFCMTSFEKLDLKDLDMNATKPETSETLVPFDTSDTPNDGNAITGISQWLFGRKA